jgi:NRAMP (natural resistance-associated macrophage protein)-like metal ion transporter
MSDQKEPSELEKIFETPAKMLEESIEFINKEEKILISKKPFRLAEEYWNTLGPGLVTGASDDDPSGIATYSQAGAHYGFNFLWLSWFTFPLMATIQEMCARIGIVTNHGLAANIRRKYPRRTLYIITGLLFVANAFNIGADLGAMAAGVQLISPGMSFMLIVWVFALSILLLQIFTTYARYAKYLKYLAFVLLAYVASSLMANLDWQAVFSATVRPTLHFTKESIILISAILGTTISPYLFFWQTSQEVEEENLKGKDSGAWQNHPPKSHLKRMRADVWSGMFFSNVVMFFIIACCAGTLYLHGVTNITSASDAALALRPFVGNFAYALFAIGIVGTGMLAVPVLAGSTSYAVSESFGWKHGLYRKLKEAYAFYGVIIISVFVGIGMNFIGIDPIKALIYSAVANAIIAPVIIFFIIKLSSNKEVMGAHVNKKASKYLGWGTFFLMVISSGAAIWALL